MVRRHPAKTRGEHMRTCVHAHTETLPANKITKKSGKYREHPHCSNPYMHSCAHTQRNHSLIPECWVNNFLCVCLFVPLQIIWYLIQIMKSTQPHGLPIFVLFYTQFILIPLFIDDVLCFELRSYVCKILGLYHVLMYVCRLKQFVVPWFFCLYRLPMYVDPIFFRIEILCM